MKLKFTKMHGTGNDFIVVDGINQDINFTAKQWQKLSDRHFGIGADQILVVEKSHTQGVDFRYRIYNSDGKEVEQCGNGARAFVKFVTEKGLTKRKAIRVETMSGIIEPNLEDNGLVKVNMGAPLFGPDAVLFDIDSIESQSTGEEILWPLHINDKKVWISVVSMGNPHAVQLVQNVETSPVLTDGKLIEKHPRFSNGVNVGFMQVVDRHQVKLRVFERGSGETMACGTGACAAVVSGIRRNLLSSPVNVETRGGKLVVSWNGTKESVFITGPAVSVFEGEIEL
jgi:diaminopimelate epimerase